ncbi:MAG TPA: tRNA (adenosine(37)-N6)-threonylcarbamoyltransferase complex dimerization subunit type 1 TsaB [Chloroflexota bacterium]
MLLAIDTSTAIAGLALYDGSVSAELTWHSGRNHSVELMPQTERLLDLRGLDPSAIEAVAVATGPGSYTGLRVGISAAKALCLALGVPVVGIPTLDVLAEPHRLNAIPVRAVLDAGRKRYATALYATVDGRFRRIGEVEGKRMAEIIAGLEGDTLLCGDLAECAGADLPDRVKIASPASSLRRASFLAEMAWREYSEGRATAPEQVEAFYLNREDG